MGDTNYLSLQAMLRADTPQEVIGWLEACIAGETVPRTFAVSTSVEGMVDEVVWLLGVPGVARLRAGVEAGTHWLTIQAAVSDNSPAAVYGAPFLVAPYCDDGMIAVMWDDCGGDPWPLLFLVQDGSPFVCPWGDEPSAFVDGSDIRKWRLGYELPDADELERYGASHARQFVDCAEPNDPVLARYLLVRSIVRLVPQVVAETLAASHDERAPGDRAELVSRAVSSTARAVLELLDLGRDPIALNDTPGWRVVEARRQEPGARIPLTGRAIRGLADGLVAFGQSDPHAGPRPLQVGQRVRLRVALRLVAYGANFWRVEPPRRRIANEQLPHLEIPAGTVLELTKVYDKGHAECRFTEADWIDWIARKAKRSGKPAQPVGTAAEQTITSLRAEDQGRLFDVEP